ncbi:MAG: Hsp20 family protein [Desulfobacterales bacterium]|nr:Hsp20 family protein [Desulfobacterales bacterium]
MIRSIPPITSIGAHRKISSLRKGREERRFEPKVYRRPRQWIYETKPIFKKIREPLVDVFREAKEVKIIIDMGSFSRGEVSIDIKPDRYIIFAKHEEQEFKEEIELPADVDIANTVEYFKNGILEITLPKKKSNPSPHRKGAKDAKEDLK